MVATQTLPSRSSKRLQLISPESPSAFVNTSVRPLMYVDKPPLVGSDPETSVAVPEQLIRIDIAVREAAHSRFIALRIGYGFEFVGDDLPESCAAHADDQSPSSDLVISPSRIPGVA